MKTTVIYHRADFDGIFCREIARKFLPEAELIGWDWGDEKIPFPDEGEVYVLDLSPDCFVGLPHRAVENLIWIDHHKSAIDKFPTEIKGYRIDGVSACRLSWQWFAAHLGGEEMNDSRFLGMPEKKHFVNRIVNEPLAVRLAGEYDIWDKRDPDADSLQFGLRSRELTEEDWAWLLKTPFGLSNMAQNLVHGTLNELLEAGRTLQRYQQGIDQGVMHRSFMTEFEGLKFLALNTARCNSLTFAAKDVPETGHDGLLGFYWNGQAWTVSLYHAKHRTELDLSTIAVKHGGGGHRGACGFRAKELPFLKAA